jgi:hypothetical protein
MMPIRQDQSQRSNLHRDHGHDPQTAFAALLPSAPVGSPGRPRACAGSQVDHLADRPCGCSSLAWRCWPIRRPATAAAVHALAVTGVEASFLHRLSLLHPAAAPGASSASHKSRLKSSFVRLVQLPLFFQPPHHHPSAHSSSRHGFRGQDTRGFGQAPQAHGHRVPIWHRRGTLLPSTCVSKG